MNQVYNDFIKEVKELRIIGQLDCLVYWDQATYMPENAYVHKSDQSEFLQTLYHSKITSKKMRDYLNILEKDDSLDEFQKTNVRKLRREYDKETKLPKDFVKRYSRAKTDAQINYEKAKNKSDFKLYLPHLEKIIELKKEMRKYYDVDNIYDVFLDEYELSATQDYLNPIFENLRKDLVPIVKKLSDKKFSNKLKDKQFGIKKQKKLGTMILKDIGYDFKKGRFDTSVHPFTIDMGNNDVRITNRYDKHNLISFYGFLHEGGHALYEQGMLKEHFKTPMAEFVSMGIHESQSRIWENNIGRSMNFFNLYTPKFKEVFKNLKEVTPQDLFDYFNVVKPSLIRTDADEVTYGLHVIIRYEIEKDIFNDKINISELPQVWNNMYEKYLEIKPKNDSEGILQDGHWSDGGFGYFPTYSLGNMYAAQMMNNIKKVMDVDSIILNGDFSKIKNWLNINVHQHGCMFTPQELIKNISGKELNPKYFIEYLKEKFIF